MAFKLFFVFYGIKGKYKVQKWNAIFCYIQEWKSFTHPDNYC